MHQDYPFVPSQTYSYIHQHRACQPTWVHSPHELYGPHLHSLQLGSHIDTCLLRCWKISYLFDPPQCYSCIHQHNSKQIRLTLSSSSLFLFSSSFFLVFVIFIPRSYRGFVYMHVLEKFGRFGGLIATGISRFEHVRKRWVRRLWGEDFNVSWWNPGMCVRIHHVTKNAQRSLRQRTEQRKILPLWPHALVMLPCGYRPRKCSLSGGETT